MRSLPDEAPRPEDDAVVLCSHGSVWGASCPASQLLSAVALSLLGKNLNVPLSEDFSALTVQGSYACAKPSATNNGNVSKPEVKVTLSSPV